MTSTPRGALQRAWLATCFAGLVAGCGGASAPSSPPPPPPPSTVTVASTVPADGATGVDVQSTLQVVFSGDVDAATLTTSHVVVTDLAIGEPLVVDLAWDAPSRTLTIDPHGLAYGEACRIDVSGVKDTAGRPLAAASVTFRPVVNGPAAETVVTDYGTGTPYATTTVVDADGRVVLTLFSEGPGPDGVWGTADDVPSLAPRQVTTWDDLGALVSRVDIRDAGLDHVWGTADDSVGFQALAERDAAGRLSLFRLVYPPMDPGGGTERRTTSSYGPDGRMSGYVVTNDAGPDGVWGTDDDQVVVRGAIARDAKGRRVSARDASGAGADGVWLTDDDTDQRRTVWTYRDDGRLATYDYDTDPGADGLWGTADDHATTRTVYGYDGEGNLVRIEYWSDSGAGLHLVLVDITAFDDRHRRLSTTRYAPDLPGPDGVFGTADDVATSVSHFDASR